MEKTNKTNCNCKSHAAQADASCAYNHIDAKKADIGYGYYSKVLNKPFDSIEELKTAEAGYYNKLKFKEDAAAQKKADAQKVEDAFKALNAARKEYKEKLTQLTEEYAEALENLKKAFELGKKDIHEALATAEENYSKALKEFTAKYENYHMTLKDGDFETTISGSTNSTKTNKETPKAKDIFDIFNAMFNL
jgi:chromosome segregation ATPase